MTATPPPASAAAAPLSEAEDRQWASFAHLGGILGILPSLIIYLVFKDRGAFTRTESKEALNFQITLLGIQIVAYIVGTILIIVFIGFLFYVVTWAAYIAGLIFSILAFLKSKDGQAYRYPFALRLIK
ncbi:DUF4870 domain-containing protein [Microcella daejeonensis]|uniref:DUF4870 domain-containing protein n=1 Tax=Microcella daejeonensis TaxID=2994971 RepID=A0A9E8S934_9MICO|nr:DUF4870 domain-containing protein [Microcella daejeonensis]WAB81066.1 DUF4870 domain-containing protein [Microcella daejeonensis]